MNNKVIIIIKTLLLLLKRLLSGYIYTVLETSNLRFKKKGERTEKEDCEGVQMKGTEQNRMCPLFHAACMYTSCTLPYFYLRIRYVFIMGKRC